LATQYLHDRILKFQNRYIAGDLRFVQSGKIVLTAHLDSLEPLTKINDADFNPPPDAALVSNPISSVGGTVTGMLVKKVAPVYPGSAKSAHVSGTVVLLAKIGMDGHVSTLYVVTGPEMLQQAALDAVRQWVYKPFQIGGEPVEVTTTIRAIFTL
jgi:TonB family protein